MYLRFCWYFLVFFRFSYAVVLYFLLEANELLLFKIAASVPMSSGNWVLRWKWALEPGEKWLRYISCIPGGSGFSANVTVSLEVTLISLSEGPYVTDRSGLEGEWDSEAVLLRALRRLTNSAKEVGCFSVTDSAKLAGTGRSGFMLVWPLILWRGIRAFGLLRGELLQDEGELLDKSELELGRGRPELLVLYLNVSDDLTSLLISIFEGPLLLLYRDSESWSKIHPFRFSCVLAGCRCDLSLISDVLVKFVFAFSEDDLLTSLRPLIWGLWHKRFTSSWEWGRVIWYSLVPFFALFAMSIPERWPFDIAIVTVAAICPAVKTSTSKYLSLSSRKCLRSWKQVQ